MLGLFWNGTMAFEMKNGFWIKHDLMKWVWMNKLKIVWEWRVYESCNFDYEHEWNRSCHSMNLNKAIGPWACKALNGP